MLDPIHRTEAIDAALHAMAQAVNDANFYCSDYAGKEQPHLESLFHIFAGALFQLEQEMAAAFPGETENAYAADECYRSKRILHRMLARLLKCSHKGLPEMMAYLLGNREFISSHKIKPLPSQAFTLFAPHSLCKLHSPTMDQTM